MPVDRTYVKRKRIKKRLPSETVFKRNDIAWALWIERDGLEAIKINTRPLIEKDLKRSSTDFEEKHEVISAFLVVVNGDSTKKGTSVTRVQNKYSSIHQNHLMKSHNRSYLQTKYLHRYSMYTPDDVLKAVYRSIERFMKRPDYQKYWDIVNHQKRSVDKFYELNKSGSKRSIPTAIDYLTKELMPNYHKNKIKAESCHNSSNGASPNR